MNIGILQSAGVAGTIIERALNHPEQQEVFTPVIYSKENGNDKNVSSDLKFGNISAVVVAPGSATEFNFPGSTTVYVDGERRVVAVADNASLDATVQNMFHSLRRDFQCSCPRIAVVYSEVPSVQDQTETEPTLDSLVMKAFSVYAYDEYVGQQMYQHFDLTIVVGETLLKDFLATVMQPTYTRFISGLPMVMAMTDYDADRLATEDDVTELADPVIALRQAVYLVMDVCVSRQAYDEANSNPLPKLYHERKDDSEKVRFAVKKG